MDHVGGGAGQIGKSILANFVLIICVESLRHIVNVNLPDFLRGVKSAGEPATRREEALLGASLRGDEGLGRAFASAFCLHQLLLLDIFQFLDQKINRWLLVIFLDLDLILLLVRRGAVPWRDQGVELGPVPGLLPPLYDVVILVKL